MFKKLILYASSFYLLSNIGLVVAWLLGPVFHWLSSGVFLPQWNFPDLLPIIWREIGLMVTAVVIGIVLSWNDVKKFM